MRNWQRIILTAFCCLSFYSVGTAFMDYFLVYPSRAIVGVNEFVSYHDLLEKAILPVSVIPFFIITILNGILSLRRPKSVSKRLLWASFICLILDWISSIFIQIPMNLELNNGKDPVLIQKVMDTNWGRIFLESLQAIIAFVMMTNALRPNTSTPKNASKGK
jgi:hypothetical protein